jgi:hypothetical protein
MDPDTMNPDKLKRQFQRFLYEKPTQKNRGLKKIENDDENNATKLADPQEESPLIPPTKTEGPSKPVRSKVSNDPEPNSGPSGVREPKKRAHIVKSPPIQNPQS